MNRLRPIKMVSAKEKVATELRRAILSKQLKEGEELLLENIASQLNVSAMPVREAFQILARDGLIKLRKNKCAVVLGVTEKYIREHYQLRAILESAATKLACRAPMEDIASIEEVHKDACKVLEEKRYTEYAEFNRAFHNEIWTVAGKDKLKNMISELWNGLSIGSMVSEEEYAKVSNREHEEILEAIKNRDEKKAEAEMKLHIYRSMDDMLTYYQ